MALKRVLPMAWSRALTMVQKMALKMAAKTASWLVPIWSLGLGAEGLSGSIDGFSDGKDDGIIDNKDEGRPFVAWRRAWD